MKRTYYCIETGTPSYPVNEIHVQKRPFRDPQTNQHCHRIRAISRQEAAEKLTDRLTTEREAALREQAEY